MKTIIYDNISFTKDEKTGYYLSSKRINGQRKRLHVYIWEKHNGKIPKGAQVHHIDGNKASTDINNMELLLASEHMQRHWKEKTEEEIEGYRKRLKANAQEKAKAWHASAEGKEWHRQHALKQAEKTQEKEYVCRYCGAVFYAKPYGTNKFCSNNCKSKFRRESGVDNEKRVCVVCSKEFVVNKYSKSECCSRSCANKKRAITIKEQRYKD